MQVSFGKIYVFNERRMPTPSQYKVTEAIKDTFNEMTLSTCNNLINVEEFLKEEKNADVFILNRKDGSVDLEIRKDVYDLYGETGIVHQGFIPYDSKGKERLKMTNVNSEVDNAYQSERANKRAWKKLKSNLRQFMGKCEQYAKVREDKENKKHIDLAEENEIGWETKLLKRERNILAQIAKMKSY